MHHLHPSLSFCEVGDKFVFLDLPGDRYFCLDGDLDLNWRAVLSGNANADQIAALKRRDLLVDAGGVPLEPCPSFIPMRSAMDVPVLGRSLVRAARHVLAVARMRRRLRRERLADIVGSFIRAKNGQQGSKRHRADLAIAASDFARLATFTTTLDQCLSRSLAVGFHLARNGFEPSLVFGVRLGSFSAHCWIECQSLLVNDRFDRVGTYQPIRRL